MICIKQLPLHEAQKIAAGEVVERPANVIKELIENSIDAGATQITLHIEDAGKKRIHIIDNGRGMSPEDARMSIIQHATSKISSVDELTTIDTFGFRGEALASIAAISMMTITTKEADSDQGIKLTIADSVIKKEEEVSCNTGTEIQIDDLFYNVPARKKFLKKRETEWRQIIQLIHACILSNLSVHFKLVHDNTQILNCPAAQNLIQRTQQMWEQNIAQHIIPLSDTPESNSISGVISNHHFYRYDRSYMFFFVNNRWIKNYTLGRAVLKGYSNVIPPDRAPVVVLFLTIDPTEIDVNIHPRKEEVQFLHPRKVEQLINQQIKLTLEEHLSHKLKKSVQFNTPQEAPPISRPQKPYLFDTYTIADTVHIPQNDPTLHTPPTSIGDPFEQEIDAPTPIHHAHLAPSAAPIDESPQQHIVPTSENESTHQYTIVGYYKKTYIILEQDDGLFIVDQHAAHERILYELFEKKFHNIPTVKLLFPHVMTLTHEEMTTITPFLSLFSAHGITIELFGENQIVVQETPVHLQNKPYEAFIREIITWIVEHHTIQEDEFFKAAHEKIRAQMACKAAVKAGDALSQEKMQQLITDLYTTKNRFSCPHGRPTGWLLSIHDIEKKFKRKK